MRRHKQEFLDWTGDLPTAILLSSIAAAAVSTLVLLLSRRVLSPLRTANINLTLVVSEDLTSTLIAISIQRPQTYQSGLQRSLLMESFLKRDVLGRNNSRASTRSNR